MTKTIGIHQPNFVPWLGYFYKIKQCDSFVYLDTAQYTKNSFQNRNKIKTPQGEHWLAIPVLTKGKFGQATNEVEVNSTEKRQEKILKTLEMNYKKAPFFANYFEPLKKIMTENTSLKLSEICIAINTWICIELGITTPCVKASDLALSPELKSTGLLVEICKKMEATRYLSGTGGSNYQEEESFKQNNIELVYSKFAFPEYKQLWGDRLMNLSILDTLFNCGAATKTFIL